MPDLSAMDLLLCILIAIGVALLWALCRDYDRD